MTTQIARGGLIVTRASNGIGKGMRYEIYREAGGGPLILTEAEARELVSMLAEFDITDRRGGR